MNKKASQFLKENIGYFCLGLFVVGGLFLFHFLLLHDDDRVYSIVGHSTVQDFLYFMHYHYNFCNGRTWVHALLIFFLRFDVFPWRIFMPLVYTCTAWLLAKTACKDHQRFQSVLVCVCVALLCVPTAVYQDTLFWESGSFNYVLPVPLILLLFLLFRKQKALWLTVPLSFLCGSSMEQYGMITFGGLLLWLGYRVLWQKDRSKLLWFLLSLVAVLGGLLTLILSPSVAARTYAETSTIVDRLSFLFFSYWFHSKDMDSFLAFLALVSCIYLYKTARDKKQKRFFVCLSLGIAVTAACGLATVPLISSICVYAFPFLFVFACIWAAIRAIFNGNVLPLFALLLGTGAQIMMLATQRLAWRTTFPSILCFLLFAVSLIPHIPFEQKYPARVLTAACVLLICIINVTGYWQLTVQERAGITTGEYAERYVEGITTRRQLDALIEECEQVRQTQIEEHLQAVSK